MQIRYRCRDCGPYMEAYLVQIALAAQFDPYLFMLTIGDVCHFDHKRLYPNCRALFFLIEIDAKPAKVTLTEAGEHALKYCGKAEEASSEIKTRRRSGRRARARGEP